MKDFIKPSSIPTKMDVDRLDEFTECFNTCLEDGKMTANTVLDGIPQLNEEEYKIAQEKAEENGYILSYFEDSYSTRTYKLTPIEGKGESSENTVQRLLVDRSILEDIVKYCEDKAIYDKLGNHGDFYYKIKRLLRKEEEDASNN